jgi:hypothetical protein
VALATPVYSENYTRGPRLLKTREGSLLATLAGASLSWFPPSEGVATNRPLSGRDLAALGQHFRVLAQPSRLHLLRLLQVPLTLQEIHIPPSRNDQLPSSRAISRQATRAHLRQLVGLGLVETQQGGRRGRSVTEYRTSHARLFAVVEELRRISLIPGPPESGDPTALHEPTVSPTRPLPGAPGFVMANGPLEGRGYTLAGPGPWTIGRANSSDLCIPHDPFVSRQNTLIRRVRKTWTVEPLGGRNGTRLNWAHLEDAQPVPIHSGDTLHVGRTLLVFRGA